MKPAIRLASLMKLHEIYVFTHDAFFVGEDGPTHEPIEQIAMLRSIRYLSVIRPAEAHEAAHAWAAALQADGPVVLLMTRQNLEPFAKEIAANIALAKGAYVVTEDEGFESIVIATGSEVNTALDAVELLRKEGKKIRLVSMPSQELFLKQDKAYQESILPASCRKRISVEAASTFGWQKFIGLDGLALGLDHFGASAPASKLAEEFGFTPEKVAAAISKYLG
jgi:transketolase